MMERPAYAPSDPLASVAWSSFVQWAFDQPDIRADFESETGMSLPRSARSGLDLMIDDATGVHEGYAEAFIEWATRTMWDGEESDTADV